MRLLEFQVKEIFNEYGIPVPKALLVENLSALDTDAALIGDKAVIKAQVPMGGRGKAGGIKIGRTNQEIKSHTSTLLGSKLKEYLVSMVLIEELLEVSAEYYLAIITNDQMGLPEIIFGTLGGVEIEQTAEQFPDAIHRKMIDPLYGVQPYEISDLLVSSVIPDRLWPQMNGIIQNLYKIYWETDSQLAEINPLVVTSSGELIAADGKMIIDDNALFRQKSLAEKRTMQSYEKTAEDAHINYIPLSGDIGMMGTGAGMAMANLDQVAHFGGNPANFMDVGPAINIHGVRAGMELLLSRADLKAILISGYTGSRLDIFAQDVVDALKDHPEFNIPIVIRLQGRNEEIGRKIFEENPFKNIYFCDDFDKAAELAVRLSRQVIV